MIENMKEGSLNVWKSLYHFAQQLFGKIATVLDYIWHSHIELNVIEGDMVSFTEVCLFSAREGGGQ